MKKISIILISLFLSGNIFAQKDLMDYKNPHFEFSSSVMDTITLEHYTKVDFSSLNYEKEYLNTGEIRYCCYIPFYVNKNISEESDFIFIMYHMPKYWSILNEKKEPIIKSYMKIQDEEGSTIGIYHKNRNLIEPISQPGKYYIKIMFDEVPTEESIAYIYLGCVTMK